jgi:uncharacterized protein (DUF58 family)
MEEVKRLQIRHASARRRSVRGRVPLRLQGQGHRVRRGPRVRAGRRRPRSIDWNVTARAGKPFIKRFIEERQLTVVLPSTSASGLFGSTVKLLARKHDVVALAVRDPRERELPDCGLIEVQDAETGQRRLVDTGSRRVRRRYGALMAEDEARLESTFRRIGVDFALIRAGEPYGQTLVDLFRRREGWR